MKVEEQKKEARSGYDMDILPPDLVTYSNDPKTLLEDLQSRNELMFLLTFPVVNMAPTRRELDNDLFTVSGIVQKDVYKRQCVHRGDGLGQNKNTDFRQKHCQNGSQRTAVYYGATAISALFLGHVINVANKLFAQRFIRTAFGK